jgi:hypothetical protein
MKTIRLIPLVILSLFLISGVVSVVGINTTMTRNLTRMVEGDTQTDLTGITVGIYESYGHQADPRVNESRTALINMFTWMNANIIEFNTTDILNGVLWACEVIAIPEGLGPSIEYTLTNDGIKAIQDWVALGGSYIGVRGSAAIAVRDSYFEFSNTTFNLALVNGTSIEVTDLPDEVMTNVSINTDCTGPDSSQMPEKLSVLFEEGRYFVPHEGQDIICIANYTHRNVPAMIAAEYGEGNLFLSSPHFEYEENSDRDGTDYMDVYDDPDSEWPLLLTITRWLVDSSPTVANVTNWPNTDTGFQLPLELIVIGGGLGVVIILVAVIFFKRR